METYEIQFKNKPIKYGKYKELVFEKQKNSYGEVSANKNLATATKILRDSFLQKEDINKNNNVLLVGKVQSGKTSNLEMLSALAFDNGFNFLIIFGGYDGYLLEQCVSRFSDTFNTDEDSNLFPHLCSTDQDLSTIIDNPFVDTAIEDERPIIICSMKRPNALNKVNDMLKGLDRTKINAIIIDDEGDQASLNTDKKHFIDENGNSSGSATYKAICEMKSLLHNPIYYAVTATPEANIFQPDISELIPESVHLIEPANLYTGADVFHLNSDNLIQIINDVDDDSIQNGILIQSLRNAINYYLISSAILLNRGITTTEMVIHVYREKSGHKQLTTMIDSYIKNIYDSIKNENLEDIKECLNEIKSVYNEKFFAPSVLADNPWNDDLVLLIKKVIKKNVKTIMQNSDGKIDSKQSKAFRYKIYVGGDLLQRGITFKHLICTYFSRWAKKGNIDTNLQRARWFGYRNDYIDLCKVFTTYGIKTEFTNLANIENDLWSQFSMAENREISLNDIVIDADDTNLNPTRGNVANYKKAKFNKLWNNQIFASFDKNQIETNNLYLENLKNQHETFAVSVGRLDNETSTYVCIISKQEFMDFVNQTSFIFDNRPFNGSVNLNSAFKEYDEVCLEFMFGNELLEYRRRSFNKEQKISALQQGADSVDITKQKYKGDSFVMYRNDIPCIQVFNIVPEIDGELQLGLKQYMFSIHFPIKHTAFIKK